MGGMDLHGKMLSEGLVKRNNEVSIVSTFKPKGFEFVMKNGVKYYNLKNTVYGSRRNGWRKESIKKYLELHQNKPFNLIWSQSFDGYGLISLNKQSLPIPVVTIMHGGITQELKSFKANFLSNLHNPVKVLRSLAGLVFFYLVVQKPMLKFTTKIITVGGEVTKSIKDWYGASVYRKCETIENGIDTCHFMPLNSYRLAARKKLQIEKDEILLLAVGRLGAEKGFQSAIQAVNLLTRKYKVRLLLVGEGKAKRNLHNKVVANGLQNTVEFTGFIENNKLLEYYNAADIFLMPTLTAEGLPLVLLEAMSCGKPVIASAIGGNLDLLEDEVNGLLVTPGDEKDLYIKIEKIINSEYLKNRLSHAARDTIVKNYSLDVMINRTLQSMSSLI